MGETTLTSALLPEEITETSFPPKPSEMDENNFGYIEFLAYIIDQGMKLKDIHVPRHPYHSGCCRFGTGHERARKIWNYIFRVSQLKFNPEDKIHVQALNQIYTAIKGEDPPETLKNEKWLQIGFQTKVPQVDFRAGGIFMVLFPLWFFRCCPKLSKHFLSQVNNETFPIMLVLNVIGCKTIEVVSTTDILLLGKNDFNCWNIMFYFFAGVIQRICNENETKKIDARSDYNRLHQIISDSVHRPRETILSVSDL